MDAYGGFTNTPDDYIQLCESLSENGSIVFSWSPNHSDAYIVSITSKFKKLGTLPFGGNPSGACMFSILMRGSFWIDLSIKDFIHKSYVSEKFNLLGQAADHIALLINGLRLTGVLHGK